MRQPDAGGCRQGHPGARARASSGQPADQPRRRRQDAELAPARRSRSRVADAAAQPAGRLGLRQGVRRAPAARSAPNERRAENGGARTQLAMAKRSRSPVGAGPRTVSLPKTATDAELKMIAGAVLLALASSCSCSPGVESSHADAGREGVSPRLPPTARAASQVPPTAARASSLKGTTTVKRLPWLAMTGRTIIALLAPGAGAARTGRVDPRQGAARAGAAGTRLCRDASRPAATSSRGHGPTPGRWRASR